MKGGIPTKSCLYNHEKKISRSRIYLNLKLWKYDNLFHCKNFLLNTIQYHFTSTGKGKEEINYLALPFNTDSNCVAVSEEG